MNWDWDKLREQQERKDRKSGPPPMDDVLEQFKGFKVPGGIWIVVLVLIALIAGASMFYKVDVAQVGVVQRFGKYARTTQPGLNFKLPMGIEKVTLVEVKKVKKEEFGFRTVDAGTRSRFATPQGENNSTALMLTGDLNVALVPWIVQYRIKDPYNYLFKVQDPRRLLRDMSEASMRLVVGDRSINEVISKRQEIADEARGILQRELDQAETGIQIVTIEMKKTNVPEPVQPSFNEVNQAIQEKERLVYKAREDYNKAIPAAKGEAERVIKAAEGYALDRVNRAEGDSDRFTAVYKEYRQAKDITERRLYLEMMRELLPQMKEKTIIDSDQQNVLPLLNLGGKGGVKP